MSTPRHVRRESPADAPEANLADVADQRLPADPELEEDDAALGENMPDDADPADVADQRREVPPESEE